MLCVFPQQMPAGRPPLSSSGLCAFFFKGKGLKTYRPQKAHSSPPGGRHCVSQKLVVSTRTLGWFPNSEAWLERRNLSKNPNPDFVLLR